MLGESFDRTLPATRRRREQSRQEGYVVQSRILTTGILLIIFGVTWSLLGRELLEALAGYVRQSLGEWSIVRRDFISQGVMSHSLQRVLQSAATWSIVLLVCAAFAVAMQTRGWFRPGFAMPTLARVSPLDNLRRNLHSLGTRSRAAAVSTAVCLLIMWYICQRAQGGAGRAASSPGIAAISWITSLEAVTLQIGAGCLAYGLLDLFLRHRRCEIGLRMTPEEWEQEQRSAARGPS